MSITINEIVFSHNWNERKHQGLKAGKLNCLAFTTIRAESNIYQVGNIFRVINNNDGVGNENKKREVMGYARIQIIHRFTIEKTPDWIAFLDTGYNTEETKKILNRIYENPPQDKKMMCILLKYLSEKEITEIVSKDIQTTIQT